MNQTVLIAASVTRAAIRMQRELEAVYENGDLWKLTDEQILAIGEQLVQIFNDLHDLPGNVRKQVFDAS